MKSKLKLAFLHDEKLNKEEKTKILGGIANCSSDCASSCSNQGYPTQPCNDIAVSRHISNRVEIGGAWAPCVPGFVY